MVEKYCSNCIHMLSGECMLVEDKKKLCKTNSLGLWFPNLKDREKLEEITGTLKESFDISESEAPSNNAKKRIINELELTLEPLNSYKGREDI